MSFICMRMKNDFHIKGSPPILVLKQRPGGTRKWPIPAIFRFLKNFQSSLCSIQLDLATPYSSSCFPLVSSVNCWKFFICVALLRRQVNSWTEHAAAAWQRSHQWCISLTPNNTKTIGWMTCPCFLRPITRKLPGSSYTSLTLNCVLQLHSA